MVQKKRNGVVRAAVVVVCLAALLPFVANGQLSATVKLGVDWLTAKVAEVGLLSNANSIANLHQQRSEAAQTLRLLATVPDALTQAVATAQDVVGDLDSETLARQLLARDPADIAAAPLLTELLKRQNQDGGFAGAVGYESHVVDTAWAVNALAQQGRGDGSEASRARAYLAGRVGDNGVDTLSPNGLSLAGSTRVIGASVASIALQTGSDAASITGAQKLSQYLRSAQGVDGGWQSDTLASAWALLALAPVSSDAAYKTAAQAFLTARQKADGSWDSDPFVTAIALRALSVRPAVTPGSATTGQVLGSVIDASSGQPLDGASVSLQSTTAGAIPVVVPSDASGAFNFSNLAAGAYQLNISRAGYQASGSLLNLSIGQKYDVGAFKLTALTTTGILKGVVTSKSTGSPLAGVTISISGSNAQTATTDSSGRFEFSALNPGSINVAATLSGYVAASGSATVVAGQTLVFSPLLYTTGSPVPTTGKFSGQIVDASSNVALDGVTVSLSGAASVQWTSSGGGVFTGDLAPGAYAVSYSKSGYTTVQQTFVLVAGSNVSAGVVKLKAALTQSSLKGHVLSDAGTPVSGAQVEIVGSQPLQFAKSAADGSYALAGLAGTRFDVRVSAAGYTSQFLTLQLDQAADVQRDFTLVAQQSGKLQFGALALDKGNVLAGIDISGSVVVQNTDSVPVQLSGLMLVQDQRGSNVATGAVLDDSGSVLGNFTLAAGETRTLYTKWNSAQFAPGMYQYIVRLVEPGSRSRAVPLGVTIAERGSLFVISEDKRIAGAVIVTPPVARAGTGSTIHLNVTLQNAGNATLVAQDYRIRIQDAATSAVVYETTATGAALPVAALAKLDFGTWPATVAGNYQVSASAVAIDVAGSASNKLYVGDAGSATFTVDRSLVPTGNQSVHAKIAVTGQDVTTGAISDPLVPLIKAAIQKSVTFNDSAARTWTVNNGCQGCHIQTQALVGGETNRKLSTFDSLARATIMNNTTLNQTEYGTYNEGYYRGYARDLTMLGMWALGSYHDKTFIASSLKLAADWTVGTQEAGGRWYSERCDLWWCSNEAFTGTNLRSIIDTYKLLSAVAPEKVKTYSIAAKPDAIALSSTYGPASYGLANDSAGRTYLSFTAGTVVQLNGDGRIGTVWSGLNSPRGLAEFQGGMVVATSSGLYKLLPDGTQTKVNDVTTFDALLVSADGKYMFSNYYAANQIVRIDANWVNEVWASGGLLSGPAGMAMDDAGRLYVTNYSGSGYILRFNMDKSSEKVLEYAYGRTNSVIHRADGWYVAGDHGIFRLNEDWEGERVWTGGVTGQLYQLPGGRFVVVRNNGLMEDIESTTVAVAPSLASYLVAIDRATTWLMASDTSGSTDVFQLAQHLVGLGEARNFYLTTDVARANTISTKMTQIANLLRANVNADGGWGRYLGQGSDSMATAQVGFALDYTNPSPSDPLMRKAVELLLTQQEASGAWHTNIAATELAATSWVSIWLPVMLDRLGGIDTDLTVTTPTTSAATAFNPPPSAITPLADGSTSYKWSMTGVTSAGRNVEFDLALANLLPNEQRPAASSAFLTFKNSFDGSLVDSPIDIPKIKATAQLDLTSATDKAAYGSNSPVLINAAVVNGAGLPTNASVQLQVFAPDGKLVSNLGTFATGSIGAGATGSTNAVWNTGSSLLAPGYSVLATLFDASGNQVSQTSIPFDITSAVSQQISARVSTDRAIYNPRDTVYITDRATNLVANSVREGLSLRTVVLNPNGQVQWQTTEPVTQLLGGVSKELSYGVGFSGALAGNYTVTLTVLDAQGATLAAASTRFAVHDTTQDGAGLSGTVSAMPKPANAGDTLSFAYTLSNAGNAALTGLPLTLRIVDPLAATASAVVAELPGSADIVTGGNVAAAKSWFSPSAPVDRNLVVLLVAKVGGKELVLAQDTFKLLAPKVKVDVLPKLQSESRVLALVSCPASSTGGNEDDGYDHDDRDDIPHTDTSIHPDLATCTSKRVKALDDYLTTLGVAHKIVTTREEFATGFHCGIYNTYWINGGLQKLDTTLAKEIREAVERGDGLIADGLRNACNAGPQLLPPVLGILQRGKLPQSNPQIDFVSGNPLATGAMNVQGEGYRVDLTTATALARFHVMPGNQSPSAAITSNKFGQGQAMLFAFDLVDMLAAQPASTSASLRDLLDHSLHVVTPVQGVSRVSRPVSGVIHLTNSGVLTTSVSVRATLPIGFKLEDAQPLITGVPQTLADGRTAVTWTNTLAAGVSQDIVMRLRAGATVGHFDLPVDVTLAPVDATGKVGAALPATSYVLPIDVAAALRIDTNVLPIVKALAPKTSSEIAARNRATDLLTQANVLLDQSNYLDTLDRLVRAADEISSITSINVSAARLAIAQGVESVSAPLCQTLACVTGTVGFSAREIPWGSTMSLSRTVNNMCAAQIQNIAVNTLLTRERTGTTELSLCDTTLTIAGKKSNLRSATWQASGQDGDVLWLNLNATWMGHALQLDKQSFKVVVVPPKLTGALTVPATVKIGKSASLTRKLTNSGGLGMDLPVTLRLTNLTQNKVISTSFSETVTLNTGESNSRTWTWTSAGKSGDQIKVEIVAKVQGVDQVLSNAVMKLTP